MGKNERTINKDMFYGGLIGAWIPVIFVIGAMLYCTATQNGGAVRFCMLSFFALIVGFLLAKDKKAYGDVVLKGLHNPMLSTIFMAYIFAGVMAQLLRQSGLINALIWLVTKAGLNTGFIPLIAFLVCVLISTSCGTSSGSVAAVAPVLLPLAQSMNINLGLMCGAIISGAIFGDNLAPISDTTISSAMTQEAELKDVVRTRFPYAVIAAAVSAVLFLIFGMTTAGAMPAIEVDGSTAKALVLLLVPVVMVILMQKGWSLISTFIVCNTLAIILDLVFGCIAPADMFSTSGPLAAGLTGMMTLVLYVMLLFMVLEMLQATGALDAMMEGMLKKVKSARSGELVIFLCATLGSALTGGSGIAILFFGSFCRQITKDMKIDRCRGANILDGCACGLTGLLPWGNPTLLSLGVIATLEVVPENFTFMNIVPYNFHCWALLVIFLASIITGIGRKFEKEEPAAAEKA